MFPAQKVCSDCLEFWNRWLGPARHNDGLVRTDGDSLVVPISRGGAFPGLNRCARVLEIDHARQRHSGIFAQGLTGRHCRFRASRNSGHEVCAGRAGNPSVASHGNRSAFVAHGKTGNIDVSNSGSSLKNALVDWFYTTPSY